MSTPSTRFRSSAPLLAVLAGVIGSIAVFPPTHARADEPPFSGPQIGEKLPPLRVRGVFDDDAGKEFDIVGRAAGKPLVVIFVHDVNRQSISLTRVLSQYTSSRAADGLSTGVVWLDDDATAAENMLQRVKHALTPKTPTGISLDGREGPGSYGLNRNVTLTILVANQGKVTANFALVQPSLQVDLPKILTAIVAQVGGKVPALSDLPEMRGRMDAAPERKPDQKPTDAKSDENKSDVPNLRPLIAPLIRLNATEDAIDEAAKAIDARIATDAAAKKEVGRIANTIVASGKLSNYGTPRAQEHLKRWAKEIAPPNRDGAKP